MTFFNKKTEVMKVELTPYGRYLLSIGKLKPARYKFFDEGVIYDSSGSITHRDQPEHQSDVNNRITNETPLLKGNPNLSGVQTDYNNYQAVDVITKEQRLNVKDDTINVLTRPLGTVKSNGVNTPAFKIKVNESKITSALKFFNSDASTDVNIPQIDIVVAYTASITNSGITNQFDTTIDYQSDEFVSGETFNISPEIPIIEILEKNGMDEKENFSVSVYKVYDPINVLPPFINIPGVNNATYTKMKLENQQKEIVDGMLLDQEEIFLNQQITIIDETELKYYFNLVYDYSILDSEFCRQIGNMPVKNIYLDKKIKCPDLDLPTEEFSIYSTSVLPSDLEDCD
jgi:hypothetical protein